MSAAALLAELRAAGAELTVEPQGIRFKAPRPLPAALLARARASKPELRALLEQPVDLAAGPAVDLAQLGRLEAPGPELPPDADPAALGALGAELPAARSSDPATSATSAAGPELPAGQVEPPVDLEAAALPSPAVVSDYPEVPSNTRARGLAAASVDGADPQQAQGNTRARGLAVARGEGADPRESEGNTRARASRTGPMASGKAAARRHPDTPQAWAAFLDEAPWIGPAERARILADAFSSSPPLAPRNTP